MMTYAPSDARGPRRHNVSARRLATWVLLLGASGICPPVAGGRPPDPVSQVRRARRCDGGRFLIDTAPIVIGASTTRVETIDISGGQINLGQCSARAKLVATRNGTKIMSRLRGCPGVRGKVKVVGSFDGACNAVSGFLKAAKLPKAFFNAARSSCGDGRVDAGAGEQCDGGTGCVAGQRCEAAACRCVAEVPANGRPVASPASLHVDPSEAFLEQQLIGTDPDGDTLTYELVSPETATGYREAFINPNSGKLYVTLAADFTGHFDLVYRASDGLLFSDPATVSIDVDPFSEAHETGRLPIDPVAYADIPEIVYGGAILGAPGIDAAVPASIDLTPLVPLPRSQGHLGSCVGWATAYALKSIQEKIEEGWDLNTNDHVFSPAYIYNQIHLPGGGAYIREALGLMVNQGVCTWSAMPYSDTDLRRPSAFLTATQQASQFKAESYGRVEGKDRMKAALANRDPVVIGIPIYTYFDNLRGRDSVYNSATGSYRGGHAVTMVGYDDSRYGGAFRVINSWGQNWGDHGYFWLPYNMVDRLIDEAYSVRDATNTNPNVPVDPTRPNPPGALPNLTVASWTASYDPRPRGQGTLRYEVRNTGSAVAAKGADVNLVLSRDATIGSGDVWVIYEEIPFDLAPGGGVVRTDANPLSFRFPDTLLPGEYYMALWVDDVREVKESNENDNISMGGTKVVILNDLPDLAVNSWYAYGVGSGTQGRLTYEVVNRGNASAPAGWDINLVLSPNETIGDGDERFLFFEEAPGVFGVGHRLYRDANNPASFNFASDYAGRTVPNGTYYVALWVDDQREVAESNELNNVSLGGNTIRVSTSAGAANASVSALGASATRSTQVYNGKQLPESAVLLGKVRIAEGATGERQATMLEEGGGPARMEPDAAILPTKHVESADRLASPVTEVFPMPKVEATAE